MLLALWAQVTRSRGLARLREEQRRFVAEVGPLDPLAYAPPRPGKGRDATPLLRGGIEGIQLEDREVLPLTELEAWSPAERETVVGILDRNVLALEMLRQARALPDSRFDLQYASSREDGFTADRKRLHASRLLALDAQRMLAAERIDDAIADIEALARLARAYLQEPADVLVLLGRITEQLQLDAVGRIADCRGAVPRHLTRCRASLLDVDLGASWRRARVRGMVAHSREWHEELMSYGGWLGLQIAVSGPSMEADVLRGARAALSKRATTAEPSGQAYAWMMAASGFDIEKTADSIKATYALRALSAAALDLRERSLRDGVYPEARVKRDVLRYVREPDGSATLELVGDRKAWPGALESVDLQRRLPAPAARR